MYQNIAKLRGQGEVLKVLRKDCNFSQQRLAIASGLSVSAIKKYESGERKFNNMSLENAFKLAMILQAPIEYFVDVKAIKGLNQRYVKYYFDLTREIDDCYFYCHKEDELFVPYDEHADPYKLRNEIVKKKLENEKL